MKPVPRGSTRYRPKMTGHMVRQIECIPVVVLNAPALRYLLTLQQPFAMRAVEDWSALHRVLRDGRPSTVVVVDPYSEDETAPARELSAALEAFPSAAVVCAFELRPARAGDVRQMLQEGISGLVNLRVDTTPAIAARHVLDAVGRPFKRHVESITPPHFAADARHILTGACHVAVTGGGVDDLSALFGVNAKTLSAWCQKFRLGSTRSLMVWIRLLLASLLLEDQGRTIESAARAAGYASDRGLRRAFEQTLGTAPSTARKDGALAEVSSGFRAWLGEVAVGSR